MQLLAFESPSLPNPAALTADPSSLAAQSHGIWRANAFAFARFADPGPDLRQEELGPQPTDSSSVGESLLSRTQLDRLRSKVGPETVQITDCAFLVSVLRAHHGDGFCKKTSRDLDVPHGTVKKWFLGQTGPNRTHWHRISIVYGPLLEERAAGWAA